MTWTGAHRLFAVETSVFLTGESLIATPRAFCTHFMLLWKYAVPDRKSILPWVEMFRATGSAFKRTPSRRHRTSGNL